MKPRGTTASSPPIQVLFALLPGSLVLDWAGPAEALRIANQALLAHGLPPRFQLHFVSPEPESISSVGLTLAGLLPLPATLPRACWVVLVGLPGGEISVASAPARALLHWLRGLRRGPHDPELSPFLAYRNHLHSSLHRVQDAVSQQPAHAWSVPAMASVAHASPRHLARLFMAHAGIAPLEYLRRIRLATAQAALQSGCNVTQAAAMAGFSSDTQLRRAWHLLDLPGTPSAQNQLLKK